MKLWRWQNGRQKDCEYKKFPLWYFKINDKFGFDAYILRYKAGSHLPLHIDPIENGYHWRMNIGWGNSKFKCSKYYGFKLGKLSLYIFRSDMYFHSLDVLGNTVKLSFGFARFS